LSSSFAPSSRRPFKWFCNFFFFPFFTFFFSSRDYFFAAPNLVRVPEIVQIWTRIGTFSSVFGIKRFYTYLCMRVWCTGIITYFHAMWKSIWFFLITLQNGITYSLHSRVHSTLKLRHLHFVFPNNQANSLYTSFGLTDHLSNN